MPRTSSRRRFTSGGGGVAKAALRPIDGGAQIARYVVALADLAPGLTIVQRTVNGRLGLVAQRELDPQPSGGGALVQAGGDGGLLERPLAHDALDIAPAERFDVDVDFARFRPGTRVRLLNRLGEGRTTEVMCFDVSSARSDGDARVPERLSSIERLDPGRATTTRTFRFQLSAHHGWTINGEPYRPGRPSARPRLGDIEVWRFITDVHHPVHVHLDPFQVVGRNNGGPGPYDAGWKDTVDVRPAGGVGVAVRFTDHAEAFMLHCHNLEHEDMAMTADFTTTRTRASRRRAGASPWR
ncbi:multicopper oxidase family protein [Promicromonospora sp. NPDC059942]|uniref:multicopper oxidase family protein n=1 Tax=Promicromonospora sp. NPDC059942 TaxID=3347009 RepID=UPI003660A15B